MTYLISEASDSCRSLPKANAKGRNHSKTGEVKTLSNVNIYVHYCYNIVIINCLDNRIKMSKVENEIILKLNKRTKKAVLHIKVSCFIAKEDNVYVASCPSLNIVTQGETEAEAQEMIDEALNLFFEDLIENKTLFPALEELDWYEINNTYKNYSDMQAAPVKKSLEVALA
jgi:predicted RNase H-like HicB family nuclease